MFYCFSFIFSGLYLSGLRFVLGVLYPLNYRGKRAFREAERAHGDWHMMNDYDLQLDLNSVWKALWTMSATIDSRPDMPDMHR